MNPQLNRKAFVVCLVELVTTALDKSLLDDAAALVAGLRVLRPRMLELDILEAWVAIKRERFADAVQILKALEESPYMWGMALAMTSMCQYRLKDPQWRLSAQRVVEAGAEPDAVALARQVLIGGKALTAGVVEAPAEADTPAPMDLPHIGFLHMRA